MPRLLFIPGSLRAASSSRAVVRALIGRLGCGANCDTADIGLLPHYNADVQDDPAVAAFISAIAQSDGVVFVTPEYNYSVPGVLKNAIDWASRPAFASVFVDKPCFVVTTSGGALGGVRAQAHLKYVLNGMLARVFPCKEVVVPMANASVTDGVFENDAVLAFAEENLAGFLASLDG
ncbi:NADPH-dependent FMN reductase [Chachezhania sediminis]|uniref:NADPH-dependent FMN reductase n=1 Tax=Chachezhania sediminis TaxID=2599291 RepID=UPI00131AA5DD|nr:NADPH-dependent FMN reductase [Chachezhania sediminis]